MKPLDLKELLSIFGIDRSFSKEQKIMINKVVNNINYLDHNTLVFHLDKEKELNYSLFNKLKNCYLVCDKPPIRGTIKEKNRLLLVSNVDNAYWSFIRYYRSLFELPVVCITGTCGKTTVKEMISQVLKNNYQVAHTIDNRNALDYNLEYLTSIDDNTDFGVFETALSYPGDLLEGCEYFKPSIGIVTNIGIDHLSGCKSMYKYIKAKGEMVAGLQGKGTLIINADDQNIKKLSLDQYQGKIITFGIDNSSDYQAVNIVNTDDGVSFNLVHHQKLYSAFIPGVGEHNVLNALATIACLDTLGIKIADAIISLKTITYLKSHLQFHQGLKNSTIIDDTWSSNPTSIEAALKVLREKGKHKTKVLVMGKIYYLGDYTTFYYQQIAKMIIKYHVDFLIAIDYDAKQIRNFALQLGMNKRCTLHCEENVDLIMTLKRLLDQNTIVLFKFSQLDKSHKIIIDNVINK